ncbi:hypothetical protein SteCoe_31262 [Stentor coeruleus]|uniref:Uncharacterized protein n=1 Tax=Stentor coeruleus TaxID=5963 RepID=A0A1R2B1P1_9CILI|nr:hypothetical protein SteCoe_31262 [Stentor coeruleus]
MALKNFTMSISSTQSILSIGFDSSPVGRELSEYDKSPISIPYPCNDSLVTLFSFNVIRCKDENEEKGYTHNPMNNDRCNCQVF